MDSPFARLNVPGSGAMGLIELSFSPGTSIVRIECRVCHDAVEVNTLEGPSIQRVTLPHVPDCAAKAALAAHHEYRLKLEVAQALIPKTEETPGIEVDQRLMN